MCKIMEVATMTRRVSQAKKRRRTTHGTATRKQNVSQAATNGMSHVSQIRPHACTHLAAKGYHRTKKEP